MFYFDCVAYINQPTIITIYSGQLNTVGHASTETIEIINLKKKPKLWRHKSTAAIPTPADSC